MKTEREPGTQAREFKITQRSLRTYFATPDRTNLGMAREVLAEIRAEKPEVIIKRRSGNHPVQAVTDVEVFLSRMEEKGLVRRNKSITATNSATGLIPPQPGEFVVAKSSIIQNVIGGKHEVVKAGKAVLDEIMAENPDLITWRRNGVHRVPVLQDSEVFFKKMSERGYRARGREKLHPKETKIDLKNAFVVHSSSFTNTFEGDDLEVLRAAKDVFNEIQAESRTSIISLPVVIDRRIVIEKMLKRGVQLKQTQTSEDQ